ncbi:unnamed protein product [Agarophyton chilense]
MPAPVPASKTQQIPAQPNTQRFPRHSILFLILGVLLGKFHTHIGYQIKNVTYFFRPQCQLGDICALHDKRPFLEDGRLSSPVWDVPRKHLTSKYSVLHRLRYGATIKAQWEYPRVVWMSAVLNEPGVNLLTIEAERAFADMRSSENGLQEASVYPHELRTRVSMIIQEIVQLIGLPSKNYVEELVFRRYSKHTLIQTQTTWCQNEQTTKCSRRFEGCGCAAVAQLTLESAEIGGSDVIVNHTTKQGSAQEMHVTAEVGDMLTWFIVQPMTESVQHVRYHTKPVQQGTKLVAELRIRNCSWTRNMRERAEDERTENKVAPTIQKSPYASQVTEGLSGGLTVDYPIVGEVKSEQDEHQTEDRPDSLARGSVSLDRGDQRNGAEEQLQGDTRGSSAHSMRMTSH